MKRIGAYLRPSQILSTHLLAPLKLIVVRRDEDPACVDVSALADGCEDTAWTQQVYAGLARHM
jgi:hypothetical protein